MGELRNCKADFSIFEEYAHSYLDNAASTHKPKVVVQAMSDFYRSAYGTVHRGIYRLSAAATAQFEEARRNVQTFIGASSTREIIFNSGATEGINLVAQSYLRDHLREGDNVVCTVAEHHANFIPWQQMAKEQKAEFRCVQLTPGMALDLESGLALIDEKTRLVAIAQLSNVLGQLNDIKVVIDKAHSVGAKVLIDAAQSVAHVPLDVQELDCDFLVFSGHKVYGPTGIGVLFIRQDLAEKMRPIKFGGEMITRVSISESSWTQPPHKFEAGTPPVAQVIGLSTAINYLRSLNREKVTKHSADLTIQLFDALKSVAGVEVYGSRKNRLGVVAFNLHQVHPHDLATILDSQQVSIRAGHHCAQPLMDALSISASARASLGIYNNQADISNLVKGIHSAKKILS